MGLASRLECAAVFVEKAKLLFCVAAICGGCAAADRPAVGGGGGTGAQDGATGGKDLGGVAADLSGAPEEPPDLAIPPDFAQPPDLLPPCMDAGTACSTGHPGACSAGHAVCVNNVLTCVPDVTTQSCYDGRAGSAGHGICTSGTQSCIGGLGPCMGEVVNAAVENCFNDTDDDCDDRVNNGCPSTIAIGPPRALTAYGGSGGGPQSARCPAGAWVTHAQFLFDDTDQHATGVRIFCAAPTLVRGANSYSISLTPSAPAPYASFQGSTYTPPDEMVDCGTSGFVAGWTIGGYSGQYVDGFGMFCANGTITMHADNTLAYTMAKSSTGGYVSYQTSTAFEQTCAPNEVLVGYDGRTGSWMDQIQAICAPLLTTYQ
jgi:hypothetical protein